MKRFPISKLLNYFNFGNQPSYTFSHFCLFSLETLILTLCMLLYSEVGLVGGLFCDVVVLSPVSHSCFMAAGALSLSAEFVSRSESTNCFANSEPDQNWNFSSLVVTVLLYYLYLWIIDVVGCDDVCVQTTPAVIVERHDSGHEDVGNYSYCPHVDLQINC